MRNFNLFWLTFLIWICMTNGIEFRYGVSHIEIFSFKYAFSTVSLWVVSYLIALGVLKK